MNIVYFRKLNMWQKRTPRTSTLLYDAHAYSEYNIYLTNKLNPMPGAASRGVPDQLKSLPNDAEICEIQLRMFTIIETEDV